MNLFINSEIFTRGVADVITREGLENILVKGKKLRVKHGIDATSPFLHIGHAANLWKIRSLQEHGHKAVIVLGDFTTRIGDPTDRSKSRPVLSEEEINQNILSIRKQVESILIPNPDVYEVRRNSEWLGKLNLSDFLKLLTLLTHARLIERDMFQERIRKGSEILMSEMLYPVLQGYDSLAIESDLTIVGSDQIFNEHLGRFFQEKFGQTPQIIVALRLVPGLGGGEKMSKTSGNYIALADSATDKFGKAMTVLDELIISYLLAYTDVSIKEIEKIGENIKKGANPMEAKIFLAEKIVARYHGNQEAEKSRKYFIDTFSKKNLPKDLSKIEIDKSVWNIVDLLHHLKLVPSRSEARRLVKQGAVEVDGRVVKESLSEIKIRKGSVVKVGKKKFVEIGDIRDKQ